MCRALLPRVQHVRVTGQAALNGVFYCARARLRTAEKTREKPRVRRGVERILCIPYSRRRTPSRKYLYIYICIRVCTRYVRQLIWREPHSAPRDGHIAAAPGPDIPPRVTPLHGDGRTCTYVRVVRVCARRPCVYNNAAGGRGGGL